MVDDNDPKIQIPKRLVENLIHCINLQKSIITGEIKSDAIIETQSLIDGTLRWAKHYLQSSDINKIIEVTLDETIEFIKTQKPDIVSCDLFESYKCREMVVEPDYPE